MTDICNVRGKKESLKQKTYQTKQNSRSNVKENINSWSVKGTFRKICQISMEVKLLKQDLEYKKTAQNTLKVEDFNSFSKIKKVSSQKLTRIQRICKQNQQAYIKLEIRP